MKLKDVISMSTAEDVEDAIRTFNSGFVRVVQERESALAENARLEEELEKEKACRKAAESRVEEVKKQRDVSVVAFANALDELKREKEARQAAENERDCYQRRLYESLSYLHRWYALRHDKDGTAEECVVSLSKVQIDVRDNDAVYDLILTCGERLTVSLGEGILEYRHRLPGQAGVSLQSPHYYRVLANQGIVAPLPPA